MLKISRMALLHNLSEIRKQVGANVRIAPVLKGNAYGHGLFEVSQAIKYSTNVDYICLTDSHDIKKLRKWNNNTKVLLINPIQEEDIKFIDRNTSVTIDSAEQINLLKQSSLEKINVHVLINTGFNRFGCSHKSAINLINLIDRQSKFSLEGIWTHLSNPKNASFTNSQIEGLNKAVDIKQMRHRGVLIHVAASEPIISHIKDLYFDLVRPGLLFYGMQTSENLAIEQALTWESSIQRVISVARGATIGYDQTTILRDSVLGIVPIGYSTGFPPRIKHPQICIGERLVNVVGRIEMEYMRVDITDFSNPYKLMNSTVYIYEPKKRNIAQINKTEKIILNEFTNNLDSGLLRQLE
ncbi:alanine racemase [Rummeliibacillus suwonensis]|uniref:alanine racemase n=1 Tax=Rummeliibacillus suwonensis TaxID=1306154 RepID=UPI001AAFB722|nr:alanine racemase [Rummeliibacillus suwonensis]MBO2535621.1 alanine racemase [Rummeliibacillus suwonensis]